MLYAFPAVDKMKRPERGYGGTGTAIRISMIAMGERAVDAKRARMPKSRLKALDDIDAEISHLKFLLKYALRAELLSFKQYDQISRRPDQQETRRVRKDSGRMDPEGPRLGGVQERNK